MRSQLLSFLAIGFVSGRACFKKKDKLHSFFVWQFSQLSKPLFFIGIVEKNRGKNNSSNHLSISSRQCHLSRPLVVLLELVKYFTITFGYFFFYCYIVLKQCTIETGNGFCSCGSHKFAVIVDLLSAFCHLFFVTRNLHLCHKFGLTTYSLVSPE